MMKRCVYSARAIHRLMEIHDYIAKDRPIAALNFVESLETRCRDLVHAPFSGRPFKGSNGILSVPFHSYLILYEVLPDTIRIANIVHGRRKKAEPFVPPSPPYQ